MITYRDFWLISVDAEFRARTCGYWYLVQTHGGTPHTAFRSKGALLRWLGEMNLNPTAHIPDEGVHSVQRLKGEYSQRYVVDRSEFSKIIGHSTRTLNNGRYVDAKITRDDRDVTTIHVLHENRDYPSDDIAEYRREDDYYSGRWNTADSRLKRDPAA